MLSDPTAGTILRETAPGLVSWIERVMAGKPGQGGFESFDALSIGLAPLLRDEIAGVYLPWMAANAEAVAEDDAQLSLTLDGQPFSQSPQRYAAKAYAELKRKRALADHPGLAALLTETGCAPYLAIGGADGDADDSDADAGGDTD
jgi:hypothetical protein